MWNSLLTLRLSSPPNNYNSFFHPNVCHICKTTRNLLKCPKCGLVSYCSMSHMLYHRAEHKELCNAIVAASKRRNFYARGINLETWSRFKWNNLRYIQETLNRKLNRHEEQLFLFAKSCLVCYSQKKIRRVCRKCFSVNACNRHNLSDVEHPCWKLQFCFNVNRYNMLKFDRNTNIWKEFICLNASAVHDMESFIDLCIERRNRFNRDVRQCSKTDPTWIFLSDDFSGPLTWLYCMKRSLPLLKNKTKKYFIIHIIGGFLLDMCSISTWEIFLHKISRGTTLIIVMIGPSLDEKYNFVNICNNCVRKAKYFQYDYRCIPYYMFSRSTIQPDVIVAFNAELKHTKMWKYILNKCRSQNCPLLITAKSDTQVNNNLMIIRQMLGSSINPSFHEENQFASQRPYRDYQTNSVYYPNKYLTFYRNLSDSRDKR